jgi:hypothetical protein
MGGTGPSGITVGGIIVKPGAPVITMGGTTVSPIAAANWVGLGIALNPVSAPMPSFQAMIDQIVGVPGSTIADFGAALASVAAAASSAGQTANTAAGNFISLITGIVGDEVAAIDALIAQLNGTASTAAANAVSQAALWTHVLNPSGAGIHYTFSSSVALTANYGGTSNPAWTAAGPLSLPMVPSGANYVASTAAHEGMVFTGNPQGAVSDHGLITDKNQVYATVESLAFGTAVLFMSGNGTTTLGQNVGIELGYSGGAAMRFFSATGAYTGITYHGLQYNFPTQIQVGDIIGLQHDGAGNYTMYRNEDAVGSTPISVTHGAGYRESGMVLFDNGFGAPTIGLGEFTARDYA